MSTSTSSLIAATLQPAETPSSSKGTSTQPFMAAHQFLLSTLANGPRKAQEVYAEARATGLFGKRTLDEAKRCLRVRAFRQTIPGPWLWELPASGSRAKPATLPRQSATLRRTTKLRQKPKEGQDETAHWNEQIEEFARRVQRYGAQMPRCPWLTEGNYARVNDLLGTVAVVARQMKCVATLETATLQSTAEAPTETTTEIDAFCRRVHALVGMVPVAPWMPEARIVLVKDTLRSAVAQLKNMKEPDHVKQ